jgi:L-histidine N-alpha-methyltransferase
MARSDPAFRADVLAGLAAPIPAVPARWLYDRRGSELFEEITRLPEYYPTRTETAILETICPEVADIAGRGRAVVEFGSGSSVKTPLLLRCTEPSAYVPIDISGDFLRESSRALSEAFPGLLVLPFEADFMRPLTLPHTVADTPKLGFFPGSTIGNMIPLMAVDLLRTMRASLGEGAMLLIGMDRIKDEQRLVSAYDDAQGVTAAFNRNLLVRANRELGADFDPEAFAHRALWNPSASRMEMHLEAARDMTVDVRGQRIGFRAGEAIHTESSRKFTERSVRELALAAGWSVLAFETSPAPSVALALLGG